MSLNVLQQLNWRYATKMFDKNKIVSDGDLRVLLESLRLSPSSYGLQPWKFIVVKNAEIREKIKIASYGQPQVTDASYLLVLCAQTDVNQKMVEKYIKSVSKQRGTTTEILEKYKNTILIGLINKSESNKRIWAVNQVYIALGFLLAVCAQMKIDACPLEGFEKEKVNDILNLNEKGLSAMVMCLVGYRSNDDKYANLAKVRFSVAETVEVLE